MFNTLSRSRDEVRPREASRIRMYSCGPTVYRRAHIGNLRTYILADWLRRAFVAEGYDIVHVKNITDIGHMRQQALEQGEDKVLAAARAEGKTPEEIARHYTSAFLGDEAKLNILPAHVFPRATDHITEMVNLVSTLLDKGFAYERQGNVYFRTASFSDYGRLSRQRPERLEKGVRIQPDPLKESQRDFALWKASEPGRVLQWPSPWGQGFPGWHIECSAMAIRHLGMEFDVHTGGVDNIFPHHEDEKAQSEAAFARPFALHWVHGQHLLVDGVKMAKSTGNTYSLADIEAKGFEPLAFRYLCTKCHYRSPLNFTLPALVSAQRSLIRLREAIKEDSTAPRSPDDLAAATWWKKRWWEAIEDDLNLPRALAIAWQLARSEEPMGLKRHILLQFDQIFGFNLASRNTVKEIPPRLQPLVAQRSRLRSRSEYHLADVIREGIIRDGYEVRDQRDGCLLIPKPAWDQPTTAISASTNVTSLIEEPDKYELSISLLSRDNRLEVERAIGGLLPMCQEGRVEVIVVDNGSDDGTDKWLKQTAEEERGLRVVCADHNLGTAAARNAALRQSRGRIVVLMDTSIEVTGDPVPHLERAFADPKMGIVGRWGLTSKDLRHFSETEESGDAIAIQAYFMAFPRRLLRKIGLLDERYRFYRHLDLDLSLSVRRIGYQLLVDTDLPLVRHEHGEWMRTPPEQRERLSKRNFYRFLKKWGERTDMLTAATSEPAKHLDRQEPT